MIFNLNYLFIYCFRCIFVDLWFRIWDFSVQERLLGAALGGVFSSLIVYEQRKIIYQTVCQLENKPPAAQIKDSVHRGRQIAHLWNKAMDQTLGPVITSMSSRGW
uniref:Uncharacterized protein n=1 Tax=Kalanchoe fedtschenkoi TaxID=63787 RepID=A0A7N0TD87_KALFE